MEIIRNSDFNVINILGLPRVNRGEQKRIIKNKICYETDNGLVILNSLTRAIVFIENDEFDKLDDIIKYEFLYKNYFLVDLDFNEWEAFEKVKNNLRKPFDDLYLNYPNSFTIITTTKCNARCGYCYELNLKKKRHMSKETAKKIADYILNFSPPGPVNIGWFGGEPLYNAKVINIICDYLREHDKMFYSTIATNGYLFDEQLVKKAKIYWNLTQAQITLDGIEDVYNNTKRYIYKNSLSPYKKVINSIKLLLKENIKVEIRMNIDNNNVENHKILINEIYNIFGSNNPKLTLYIYPIFEENSTRTEEDNIKLYNSLKDLDKLITNLGYAPAKVPTSYIQYNQCMCDNGQSVLIGIDGDLGLCEHFPDSNFFSNINNPLEKNDKEILKYKTYINTKELCDGCPILGDCPSLSGCFDFSTCTDYKKDWRIESYKLGLKFIYENYLKNKFSKNNENN